MASIYSKMCRTCLSEDTDMCSIFDVNSGCDNIRYSQLIGATTGVQVTEYDGLPPLICTTCKQSATHAYHFKQQSKKADLTLRSLILKRKPSLLQADVDKNIKSEHDSDIKYEFHNEMDDAFDCSEFDISSNPDVFCTLDTETKKETKKELSCDHICTTCNGTFDNVEVLRSHILVCVKEECEDVKALFCPVCGQRFQDSPSLLKHVFDNHNNGASPKKRGRPRKLLTKATKKKTSKNVKSHDKASITTTNYCESVAMEVSVQAGDSELTFEKSQKSSCDICNVTFDTQLELNTHFGSHNGGEVLRCSLCKKMYLEPEHFNHHLFTHHDGAQAKNIYENMTFQFQQVERIKPQVLDSGEQTVDMIEGKLSVCTKRSSLEELLKAEDTSSDQLIEQAACAQVCGECGELLLSTAERMQHNDLEHPELSSRCNFCSKLFSSAKTAARHRKGCKHMECKHECYTCGLKFAYELTLNKHILREHKGQSVSVNFMKHKYKKNFTCKTCNKGFSRQELLDRHFKTHSPNVKKYECDICKRKFNRKDNLRSHMQIHDPKRIKVASNCLCLYCGRSFSNSSNLIVHMRRHTGEKPYKCDFCGKGFPRSSDLQCHRRSHTGEKPYLCNICGKGFRRNNKLSRHMRVHTGQRPYKCIYCEKAFSQSNDLTLHIRRHTGDKPYVCEVCGDRFIQGTALHNHRRSHNHYPPSTSEASTAPFSLLQPKPIRTLTAVTVKKISDTSKM